MAKQSCCHKKKLRRGLWSPEEDEKLMNHIAQYGHGCWSSVPKLAGIYSTTCVHMSQKQQQQQQQQKFSTWY